MSALKINFGNALLNEEVIKYFVDGVKKTMSLMANTEVTAGRPKFIYQFKLESEVAGVLGLSTDKVKGSLVLSFEKDCILKIYNTMMKENETELTSAVVDLVGEFTNVIYGSAKTSLNHAGYHLQMSLPSVVTGSFQLTKKSLTPSILIPFEIHPGLKFCISISVE